MYHTSQNELKKGTIDKSSGIAGNCLFFSDDVYSLSAADKIWVYEADFNCISAWELHDEEIISEIAERFNVDGELAEGLLDATKNEWDMAGITGEDSWWLQGKRGECAVKMGYDGAEDEDEQGRVYIIPMIGREEELKLVEVLT